MTPLELEQKRIKEFNADQAFYDISVAARRLLETLPKNTDDYWIKTYNSDGELFLISMRKQ